MKHTIILAALLATAAQAQAQDSWTGRDKQLHAGLSAALAAGCTVATERPRECFWATLAIGAAKELYDAQHRDRHTPSWKDMGANTLGAYIGTKAGTVIIRRNFVGFTWSI